MRKSPSSRRIMSVEALDGAVGPHPLNDSLEDKHKVHDHSAEEEEDDASSPGSHGDGPKPSKHHHHHHHHGGGSSSAPRRSGLTKDGRKHSSRRLQKDDDDDDHHHQQHHHHRLSSSSNNSSKKHLTGEPHWTELVGSTSSSSRRSGLLDDKHTVGLLDDKHRKSSKKLVTEDGDDDIISLEGRPRRHSHKRTSDSRSPHRTGGSRRSSRRLSSKSPSKSPSRSKSNRGSRQELLDRSKSPSRSNRGSRRDLLQQSPSKSNRGSRRDLMERSKSPSRSNRGGGGSRRDLMQNSPSKSNRGSRRDLIDRSQSPSTSRRASRSMRQERSSNHTNRPSLQDLDGIPNLIEAHHRDKNSCEVTSDEELVPSKKKLYAGIIICLMLLLGVAAGVAWFLLTEQAKNVDNAENGDPKPPTPTVSPTKPLAPPTPLPTGAPSHNPSNIPQLFQRPSPQDCFNILRQLPVANQQTMIPTPFGLDFDVTISPGTDTALWIDSFMVAVVRDFVPDLTGCSGGGRRRQRVSDEEYDHLRHRRLNAIRYAIGNADATGFLQPGVSCQEGAPQPCYRFVVRMDLYLKDVLSDFQLISLVVGIVNPPNSEESLVERLRLPTGVFENVAVVLLGSTTESPSSQPSELPSEAPSTVPSTMPSLVPSDSPTPKPTLSPTLKPSTMPSLAPSLAPSSEPTLKPSSQPSSRPSVQPSLRPSRRPSSRPSVTPSKSPS